MVNPNLLPLMGFMPEGMSLATIPICAFRPISQWDLGLSNSLKFNYTEKMGQRQSEFVEFSFKILDKWIKNRYTYSKFKGLFSIPTEIWNGHCSSTQLLSHLKS